MVNWSNYKLLIITLITLFSISFTTNKNWGFAAHQTINEQAVFLLPDELFLFYKKNLGFIKTHAVDPDKRRYTNDQEAYYHYIDLDYYSKKGINIQDSLPRQWKKACDKFSKDSLIKHGIAPWYIIQMKYRLQTAFFEKNLSKILKITADLGHYVGDLNVPLHTTENYNGQLTNQKGIHSLWETRLVELFSSEFKFSLTKAKYLESIQSSVWNSVLQAHQLVDSVLNKEKETSKIISETHKYSFENKGNILVKVYSYEFCKAYFIALNGMIEQQQNTSIQLFADIIYTAWVDAGQPTLNAIQLTKTQSKNILNDTTFQTKLKIKEHHCDEY